MLLAGTRDVRAILAVLLRSVERRVRALEEARRRIAVEELGDAAREAQALLVRPERRSAHRVVHATEELLAVLGCRLGHDHRELVTTDPAGDVGRANRLAKPVGGLREDTIAREVADLVVDRLEVVEVEDDQRQLSLVAMGPRHLAAERLLEEALVEQAGERIRLGELPRLAVAPRVLDRGDAAGRERFGLLDLRRAGLVVRAPEQRERPDRPELATHQRDERTAPNELGVDALVVACRSGSSR